MIQSRSVVASTWLRLKLPYITHRQQSGFWAWQLQTRADLLPVDIDFQVHPGTIQKFEWHGRAMLSTHLQSVSENNKHGRYM